MTNRMQMNNNWTHPFLNFKFSDVFFLLLLLFVDDIDLLPTSTYDEMMVVFFLCYCLKLFSLEEITTYFAWKKKLKRDHRSCAWKKLFVLLLLRNDIWWGFAIHFLCLFGLPAACLIRRKRNNILEREIFCAFITITTSYSYLSIYEKKNSSLRHERWRKKKKIQI